MSGIVQEPWSAAENGSATMSAKGSSRELRGRTAHSMSSSSLRKKSDLRVIQKVPYKGLKDFLSNLQEVILGTKLAILFPAIPAAIIGTYCGFTQVSFVSCFLFLNKVLFHVLKSFSRKLNIQNITKQNSIPTPSVLFILFLFWPLLFIVLNKYISYCI